MDANDDVPDRSPPADDRDALLTGTPAFDALFAALEHSLPLSDIAGLNLLFGSNVAPFG